jgi:THO complex subunit 3
VQGKEVRLLRGHLDSVSVLAFHPLDPSILAATSTDRTLKIWDVKGAGRVDSTLSLPIGILSLKWRPDGSALVAGTAHEDILLIDFRSGRPILGGRINIGSFLGTSAALNELSWFPGPGSLLFAAVGRGRGPSSEGIIGVFAVEDDYSGVSLVTSVVGHTADANMLKFDPSGRFFATGGTDSLVCLWDAMELTVVRTFDRMETIIRGLSFSFDGQYIAAASSDRAVDIVSRCPALFAVYMHCTTDNVVQCI